ncbi:hypothetical protein [Methylobacterium sp. 77]|uniref:hypothetical protein n=1 Tax=Methylobacterium sp. 77 TaxID=1101192 RepID=UPI0009DB80E3|nr:hypothetical protein [Methylobacterium sp. 77]
MRELYASSNGDRWHLIIEESTGHTFVRHNANEASGGNIVDMALPIFLSLDSGGPEHQALWAMIRTLVSTAGNGHR